MVMSSAVLVATLLAWPHSLVGGINDDTATARIAALPTQAAGTKEVSVDPAHGSGNPPTRPTCAGRGEIAAAQETDGAAEPNLIGCGPRGNLAGDAPAGHVSQ